MFSYFKNRKTTYFDVFCLNFSIETKIKTFFLISYFNLLKKRNGTLGTRILTQVFSCGFCEISKNTFFTEHLWASASALKFDRLHVI